MKLKDLKKGQKFKFANGYKKDKGVYQVLSTLRLAYKAVNGGIHYKPKQARIGESIVIVVTEESPIDLILTDQEGDIFKITAEAEANYLIATMKYTFDEVIQVASFGFSKQDVIDLIQYLETQLAIKG